MKRRKAQMWRIDSRESLIDRSALLQPELGVDLGIWWPSVLGTGWWLIRLKRIYNF
jgi:hypothetical protein